MSLTNVCKEFTASSVRLKKPSVVEVFQSLLLSIEVDRISGMKQCRLYQLNNNVFRDEIVEEFIDRGFKIEVDEPDIIVRWL
jgi:hypothetical protein